MTTGLARVLSAAATVSLIAGCAEIGATDEAELEELGLELRNGLAIDNGLKLTNGATLSNGIKLTNGIDLANGIDAQNGIKLTNGALLNGSVGPTIAPPRGSGLEQWIDVDPANQLRTLQYLIQCALPSSVTVRVVYRGTTYWYGGRAGLGPSLQNGLMPLVEQEKVSACLLARVNAQARTVAIDMFGPMSGMDTATSAELASFSAQEGAFFGNLFLATPKAHACALGTIALGEFRACSRTGCGAVLPIWREVNQTDPGDSLLDLGPIAMLVGCFEENICNRASLGGGYSFARSCAWEGQTWAYPVTTHLRPALAGEECYGTYQCADGLECSGWTCQ